MFLIDEHVVARQFGADQIELDILCARRDAKPGFNIERNDCPSFQFQNRKIGNAHNLANTNLRVVRVQSMHNLRPS